MIFYSKSYDDQMILGDFYLEIEDQLLHLLLEDHDLYSVIRTPTCFKSY